MKRHCILLRGLLTILLVWLTCMPPAEAFCGFYVASADSQLYNQASQVAIARDGHHTVLTMANDYQGEVDTFALVVPVPTVIQREQVAIAAPTILERLDAFSAPRLVEYFDPDPCEQFHPSTFLLSADEADLAGRSAAAAALGVTIEAAFTVGEYDIVVLSAQESAGLETWLQQNNYQIPAGAREVLGAYIRQGLKFFVAKVNLEEYEQGEYQQLRPLQITYDSPRFMLPIRLGMVNADGPQDLVVYLLTRRGRVEVTNYRTVQIPSNVGVPVFIKDEFGAFYRALFERSYTQQGGNVAFLEYAWDLSSCDPCAADPLSLEEMRQAGIFWLPETASGDAPRLGWPQPQAGVFITRLHVRYTRDRFPEDLAFQETSNRQLFQGRYIIHHPFTAQGSCRDRIDETLGENDDAADTLAQLEEHYRTYVYQALPTRFERESQNLARLTGWDIHTIRRRISQEVPHPSPAVWRIRHPARE